MFGIHAVGSSVEAAGYLPQLNAQQNHFAVLYGPLGHVFNSLGSGVSIFFVLSAYLLSRPFLHAYIGDEPIPSLSRYLRNRALRILPAFWVVLVLVFVLFGTRGDSFWESLGLASFISSFKASGLHGVFGQPWSLNVEVRFYVLLPLAALVLIALKRALGRRLPRWARIVLVLGLIALGFDASQDYAPHDEPFYDSFAANAAHFAPGLLLAVLEHIVPGRAHATRWARYAAPPMFAAGLGLTLFSQYLSYRIPSELVRYILPLGAGLILAGPLLWQWAGVDPWRALDNRPLRWIGERSYSLFLVHSLVIAALAPLLATGGYWVTLAVLGPTALAGSLLAAALLYRYVEQPALRLKARTPRLESSRSRPSALFEPLRRSTMSADDDGRPADAPPGDQRAAAVVAATLVAGVLAFAFGWEELFGLDDADRLTAVALIGVLATAVVLAPDRAGLAALALLGIWMLGYAGYSCIPDWIETPIPVHEAVGGAAFFQSSYVDQQLAGAFLVGAVLAAGILFALWSGRSQRADAAQPVPESEPAPRRARRLMVAAVVLVVLTLLPDLHHVLIEGSRGPLPMGWDYANFIAWDYFQQHGLVAMQDYWFPYGAEWLLRDFPTGPVLRWIWQAGLLAAAGWALWRLAGPKPGRIALCLLAMVAVGLFDQLEYPSVSFAWRYLPALVLAICYAAVGPLRHREPTWGHVVFGVVCGAVGAMAADVLLIGLAGAAFVAVGEFVFDPVLRTWRTIRSAVIDLLPVLGGVGIMLAFWALTRSLDENLSWYTAARAVSAASGPIQDQDGALVGLQPDPSLVTVEATFPALVLAAAFYQRRFGGETATVTSRLLLAAAGCATLILAKHLVRPQGLIVLILPVLALLWVAILQWQTRSLRAAVATGLFVGAFLGMLQQTAAVTPTRYLGSALSTPVHAVENLALAFDRGQVRAAGNARFAPERMAAIPEKTFIADKLAPGLSGPGDSRFAVLGDAQLLYVIFAQRPPGHISLYDAARRSEQERWIAGVRALNPRLLVWRRDLAIDGIPYPVRDPLVFSYAVANYVPQQQGEPMDVLRRRTPVERVATGYWRKRIGAIVGLGGIPAYSRGDEQDRCSGGTECVPYAIVSGASRTTGKQITVKVQGTPYGAVFSTRKGVDRYAIRLDRLWFWPYAGGRSARLTTPAAGWKVEVAGVRASDDLY